MNRQLSDMEDQAAEGQIFQYPFQHHLANSYKPESGASKPGHDSYIQ